MIQINRRCDTRTTTGDRQRFDDLLAGEMTATWYVTFEVRRHGTLPKPRSPRETRTFATEAEAKAFVRAKLDQGLVLFAGTINPHAPRQLIPSSRIQAWLAGEQWDTEGDAGPDVE